MSGLLGAVTARGAGRAAHVQELGAVARSADGAIAATLVGSIANARMLRALLEAKGYDFDDGTASDAEIVAQLVHASHKKGLLLFHAVRQAVKSLSGRYALLASAVSEPECLVVAQQGGPVIIGFGGGEQAVAGSEAALPERMTRCLHLEDGDVAELRGNDIVIVNASGQAVLRRLRIRETPARAA